jgi:hypothetical protein
VAPPDFPVNRTACDIDPCQAVQHITAQTLSVTPGALEVIHAARDNAAARDPGQSGCGRLTNF